MNRTIRARTPFTAIHRIILDGEYDLTRKEELSKLFDSVTRDRPLTIDFRRVSYADSTVLNLLASLAMRFREMPITLLGTSLNLQRLFRVVLFEKLFRFIDAE